MSDAAARMDAIYHVQRHFYDVTRKPYLLGRDALISDLQVPTGGRVLEIGCGTGRNLVSIARRYPGARCYAFDVSSAMLQTARNTVSRSPVRGQIVLAQADATSFDPVAVFGIASFDRVVLSYVLSMIPPWESVLRAAHGLVAPGGQLHVVDFGDQAHLPGWFASVLNRWLALFEVTPRSDLAHELSRLSAPHADSLKCRSIGGGYALMAALKRSAEA